MQKDDTFGSDSLDKVQELDIMGMINTSTGFGWCDCSCSERLKTTKNIFCSRLPLVNW